MAVMDLVRSRVAPAAAFLAISCGLIYQLNSHHRSPGSKMSEGFQKLGGNAGPTAKYDEKKQGKPPADKDED